MIKISNMMKAVMIGNTNGISDHKEGRNIFVYDANTGEYFNTYISVHQCHRLLIKSKSMTGLNLAIKNNGTYKGYMFFYEYKGKFTNPREISPIKNKIKVICLNNNIIFDSISSAVRKLILHSLRVVERRVCMHAVLDINSELFCSLSGEHLPPCEHKQSFY
jgi:hypothetical protein